MEEQKGRKITPEHVQFEKKKVGGALAMRIGENVPFKMHTLMRNEFFCCCFFFKPTQSPRMKAGTFAISGKSLTVSKVEKKKAPAKGRKTAVNVCE